MDQLYITFNVSYFYVFTVIFLSFDAAIIYDNHCCLI